MDAASPLALLQRGYVLVTTPAGVPVTTAASVKPGGRLRLRFGDGEVDAVAQGGAQPAGGVQGGAPRGRPGAAQETLDL